ncbi:hypothetical protein [Neomegalonema sp.]|uniref:hypothetical protein n=1 Tax=Neomegalonema sp. TaxID=2039713 RepID=UPI00262FC244|nr:hypothetical protein [Neomegalonema sp.]MDD2867532.1 hypothetical protein [Neomegalonema sp.]
MALTKDDFRRERDRRLAEATARRAPYVDLNAGELHRALGDYPGPDHRMPVCCDVLQQEQRLGDVILSQPLKGKGASLTIRFKLPR